MSEQPDSIGTGGNLGAQRIPNYDSAMDNTYRYGDIVMGTDGNLWQRMICMGNGESYWQRMQVLNVETMQLEGE